MKHHIKSLKILFSIAPGQKSLVIQTFLGYILEEITELLPPIATAGIIGVITKETGFHNIWLYVVLYVVFYAIIFAIYAWNAYTYTTLADHYHNTIQSCIFEHIVKNESILDKISQGKITDTTIDDIRYAVDVLDKFARAVSGIIKLVIIFAIFASYNIPVAVVAATIDIIYILVMDKNSTKISRYYDNVRKHEDRAGDILNQMLTNLRQVKSLNMMEGIRRKLAHTRSEWGQQYRKKRFHNLLREAVIPSIIYGGEITIYILLAYLAIRGKILVSDVVLLASYFTMVITTTNLTLDHLLDLSDYDVRIRRIKAVLDYSKNTNFDYGDIDNDYIEGRVVFEKVNYIYDNRQILKNVSFKAFPNRITVIVGHPGAGKTTIINLLYRLYHVKSGQITIDEESIYNYSEKVYYHNISGVFQRPFTFKMSISDNLSLIDKNHQHQIAACKRVGIHKKIISLPKGYSTILDKDHPILTDGDLQKLAIARALLSRAEILLFDEVTNNIDAATTLEIGNILKDLKEDHTIIITTHKPDIMEIADNVVVMRDGHVSDKGDNDEVYKRSALYRQLRSIPAPAHAKTEE